MGGAITTYINCMLGKNNPLKAVTILAPPFDPEIVTKGISSPDNTLINSLMTKAV